MLPYSLMSIWGEKSSKVQSAKNFSKIRPNNLVRLIGQSLSSVLADCTLGLDVIADYFHLAGKTPSCKDTLKI